MGDQQMCPLCIANKPTARRVNAEFNNVIHCNSAATKRTEISNTAFIDFDNASTALSGSETAPLNAGDDQQSPNNRQAAAYDEYCTIGRQDPTQPDRKQDETNQRFTPAKKCRFGFWS
jgi:hypothetical protein